MVFVSMYIMPYSIVLIILEGDFGEYVMTFGLQGVEGTYIVLLCVCIQPIHYNF